ncbi:uncharacterized protein LOC110630765 isoform X2 [Manihot esculenta]|uniref:uncharacterized protein LOC110630765 isoform X2 n=1 Tax=Manihot esculenta TaxID=3983 RepID=UPI001CC4DE6D|nr:uncharacterized protein LOC110630765 isoform X2 [Manihot esculenta]
MSHAKKMELLLIFPALSICLSVLLTSCGGVQIQEQAMVSKVDEVQFDLPAAALPRKLRVVLDEKATLVNDHGGQGSTSSSNLQREDISVQEEHIKRKKMR